MLLASSFGPSVLWFALWPNLVVMIVYASENLRSRFSDSVGGASSGTFGLLCFHSSRLVQNLPALGLPARRYVLSVRTVHVHWNIVDWANVNLCALCFLGIGRCYGERPMCAIRLLPVFVANV